MVLHISHQACQVAFVSDKKVSCHGIRGVPTGADRLSKGKILILRHMLQSRSLRACVLAETNELKYCIRSENNTQDGLGCHPCGTLSTAALCRRFYT